MMTRKAIELSDEMLINAMRDYMASPTKYYPQYLAILITEYERRVKERMNLIDLKEFRKPPIVNELIEKIKGS